MGCTSSKPHPTPSKANRPSTSTSTTSEFPPRVSVHATQGHSDVSRPPLAPRKHTLSEIFDPDEIPPDGHVRSPSGNLLDAKQFREYPGRPLCKSQTTLSSRAFTKSLKLGMRERQERILQRTQTQYKFNVANPTQIAPFAFEKDQFNFGNTTTVRAQEQSNGRKSSQVRFALFVNVPGGSANFILQGK